MIKFKVQVSDLLQAISVVSVVTPRPVDKAGGAGYLFVIRAGGSCTVYSQEQNHMAAAGLTLSDVEGEGAFIYPIEFIGGFKHLPDEETLSFETGERDGSYYVNYTTGMGGEAERPSFDPRSIRPATTPDPKEGDLEYPANLLKRAIDTVKSGLPDDKNTKAKDFYKSIQVFDSSKPDWAPGDGNMFASDGTRGSYFYCDSFKGKALSVHKQNLTVITGFLSKCDGNVIVRNGENWTFLVDSQGRMIGWTHSALSHPKYSYYKEESIQLMVNTDFLCRTLRYMKEEMEASKSANGDRIRMVYEATPDAWCLQFLSKEAKGSVKSPLITVTPQTDEAKTKSFATNVSIQQFLELVSSLESKQLLLKVLVSPPNDHKKKESFHFRILERFWVDPSGKVLPGPEGGIECRVTRFIPSKD